MIWIWIRIDIFAWIRIPKKNNADPNTGWGHVLWGYWQGDSSEETSTLSEKLGYLFFSLGYFRAISWTYYNKYFGKIFSALCVDVFPELLRIFPNFYILWYMMKDAEVPLTNCLLIHTCSSSQLLCSLIGLLVRVFASHMGGQWIESPCHN
jgi:hypothetical protein